MKLKTVTYDKLFENSAHAHSYDIYKSPFKIVI